MNRKRRIPTGPDGWGREDRNVGGTACEHNVHLLVERAFNRCDSHLGHNSIASVDVGCRGLQPAKGLDSAPADPLVHSRPVLFGMDERYPQASQALLSGGRPQALEGEFEMRISTRAARAADDERDLKLMRCREAESEIARYELAAGKRLAAT